MTKASKSTKKLTRQEPAKTPEAREQQMIALATNVAEQQLLDGTASSAVIVHYLKLGTAKAQLEMKKLEHETALVEAKTSQIEEAKASDKMYKEALEAMKIYSGNMSPSDDYGYDYD